MRKEILGKRGSHEIGLNTPARIAERSVLGSLPAAAKSVGTAFRRAKNEIATSFWSESLRSGRPALSRRPPCTLVGVVKHGTETVTSLSTEKWTISAPGPDRIESV